MNFRNIRLENERSTHVTKRLNRLNTWKFFQVLYRENMWRVFGFSLLVLLLLAPIFVMLIMGSIQVNQLQAQLPTVGDPFTTGAWIGVDQFFKQQSFQINVKYGLLTVAVSVVSCLIFSGGLAVIRDAFWTGRLNAKDANGKNVTGVFKSMWSGISANVLYAFVTEVIIAFSLFGIIIFGNWSVTVMPVWVAVICIVLMSILLLLITTYLLILCSVSVTYKQSVAQNIKDAWLLMWMNILPNILNLLFAILPVGLYLITAGGMLQSIVMVLIFMFGGMYFPLVWQSHMMRTFALFHPVDTKKKGSKNDQVGAEEPATPSPATTKAQ